ncbi:unnamed protein product [Miscanthus lutarioriparius]|uniref:Leucine-rich repeat-containing N-terminal plant-type domain-containing protein n=1 Tax=Miscanthus lutarioriparius TaxID=422564 RepID=A0A811SII6_9POAL|nr:unnamed protein product [Miscanthus lutarioriparius]
MKAAATGRFLLVLMACSVHAVTRSSSNTTPGNQTDRLSLLEFKNSISLDPQQALASWNDSTHFCNWEGLVGQISPSARNLTFLKQLSPATNRFSGQIPAALGQLHRLQTLYLSNNTLHGVIPTFGNCSNLEILWLNGNNLVGGFPDLPLGLKQLELGSNNLSGTIPPSLTNITTLVPTICFTGVIPSSIGKLGNLYGLNLEFNKLKARNSQDWEFIYSLGNCSNNNFTGFIPSYHMNLTQLSDLGLQANKFEGHVPTSIGVLQNLQNSFGGSIPVSLGNIRGLEVLDLSHNNLTWSIPMSLTNLQYLEQLDLSFNNISCQVPLKGIFSNVTAVRIDGNPGLCGGPLELHLLACHVMPANSTLVYEFMTQGGLHELLYSTQCDGNTSTRSHITMAQRRPTDDMFNGEMNITKFVEMNFPDRIPQIIDPELLVEQQHLCPETSVAMKEKSMECLLSFLNIGLLCTKPSPNERICMQEVTARLHGIKKAYIS